ncbi:MAG TPA: class I SAM-dependent rRNA methyltransferase [Alphaproteobacteria bacterium]|nr:class I SAM-dependent rRNA methyltransferase [Alphaproteobacteria bacterium]
MNNNPQTRPTIRLLPKRDGRVKAGHPWVYSNEIAVDAAAKAIPPGSVVNLVSAEDRGLGTAFFNPHTLIAARLLSREPGLAIDNGFFLRKFRSALALRARLYEAPFYRLVHAEADGLPAVIVDRMGDVLSVQLNAAGPAGAEAAIVAALTDSLHPTAIVLKNDSPARKLEGLEPEIRLAAGMIGDSVEIVENGARFLVHPLEGQKTGWFYDQRDSRAFVARFARDARVLDAYCYGGGFGVLAAFMGARSVLMLDRSQAALDAAMESARLNHVADRCAVRRLDVFDALEALRAEGQRFEIVIVDPPAFAKSRKEVPAALRGYRKLVRLAATLAAPRGILFAASCSHNVEPVPFGEAVAQGLADAGRSGRILRQAGAGPDHPIHPMLPESAYLKSLTLAVD